MKNIITPNWEYYQPICDCFLRFNNDPSTDLPFTDDVGSLKSCVPNQNHKALINTQERIYLQIAEKVKNGILFGELTKEDYPTKHSKHLPEYRCLWKSNVYNESKINPETLKEAATDIRRGCRHTSLFSWEAILIERSFAIPV